MEGVIRNYCYGRWGRNRSGCRLRLLNRFLEVGPADRIQNNDAIVVSDVDTVVRTGIGVVVGRRLADAVDDRPRAVALERDVFPLVVARRYGRLDARSVSAGNLAESSCGRVDDRRVVRNVGRADETGTEIRFRSRRAGSCSLGGGRSRPQQPIPPRSEMAMSLPLIISEYLTVTD